MMEHLVAVLYILYVVIAVVALFGITIFVHELGHFLTARCCGMVIEVFSVGFGPAIWKKRSKGVLYKVSWIPLGGYVALPQMDPETGFEKMDSGGKTETAPTTDEASKPDTAPIPKAPPTAKIVVALAGSVGNMALAIVLAWIVFWIGKPSAPAERCAVIGYVATNSDAFVRGIRIGDEMIAVNAVPISNWSEFLQEGARYEQVRLTIKTGNAEREVDLPTVRHEWGFHVVDGLEPVSLCRIMAVEPGSSAEKAGLKMGDVIRRFDSREVLSREHLVMMVNECADQEVPVVVERDGRLQEMDVTPLNDPKLQRARIGVQFDPMAVDYDRVVHIPPGVQIREHATAILRIVRSLVTPKEAKAASEGLGGPVMILFLFQDMVRKGLAIALWFTCFLNVNLAILNLLPIPILDGGHILFSLWEMITRRRVHPLVFQWLCRVFAALLIGVFILLTGRDFLRLVPFFKASVSTAVQSTNAVPGESR